MALFHIEMMSNALARRTAVTAIVPLELPQTGPDFSVHKPEKPFPTLYLLHGYQGGELDWLC